jgi:hypothetical protein
VTDLDLTGARFGNYVAKELLGKGGFGSVYLAEHPLVGRKAAVKVLHPTMAQEQELVTRFFNEARAASAINHPYIVDVFDAGTTSEGLPYIVMELLNGETLRSRLTRLGRLEPSAAVQIVCQTASALDAAHKVGIVHRDLKPENIFLVAGRGQNPREATEHVKVLDFGIAKLGATLAGFKTQAGQMMGSPRYMSPEQWSGAVDLDHRTDIYALGIILFELLVGTPPFEADDTMQLRNLHLTAVPPALAERNVVATPTLEAVVRWALAKKPEARWGSASEFAAAFGVGVPAAGPRPSVAVMAPSTQPIHPASGNLTTLSGRTGEMAPGDARGLATTRTRRAADAGEGRGTFGKFPSRLIAVSAVGLGVLLAFLGARSWVGEQLESPITVERPARTLSPGSSAPVAPAQSLSLPKAAPPVPAAPPIFSLQLRTRPSGATVLDETSGKDLGQTPLTRTFPETERPHRVRLVKKGYEPQVLKLTGAAPLEEVRLQRKRAAKPQEEAPFKLW